MGAHQVEGVVVEGQVQVIVAAATAAAAVQEGVEGAVPELVEVALVRGFQTVAPQSVVVELLSPLQELVAWPQHLHLQVNGRCSSLENIIWTS